ncbi:lipopolysaccharide heptosyltransferase II [Sulfurihydrogenibium subterraneum]|uniref:lipopolysaccharide heptosyltransferase II n=1 Tax=Sulfurihydrogenibium subterraneum TaxID=171121 RepID=UPI00048D386A|nr:lipopolysaccharide heptosyltransferase II [Sulfurihydrogenibium subterraneum]
MKILLYQTAFLGDLILTTPLIESIKKIYPQSNLTVISKPFGKEVLKNNPFVDRLITFDKNKDYTLDLIKTLRREKFDIAISPHRSHRASYILFLTGIPKRIGFDKAGFSFLYTDVAPHRFDSTHEIDRNLKILEKLPDYKPNLVERNPKLYLDPEEDSFYKSIDLKDKSYIVIAPGSKWETKRWTDKGFAAVIDTLIKRGETVVLIGSGEDLDFVEKILSKTEEKPINLVGKTNLRQTFSLIKHSKLLISNDSAPVHMAVSFDVPVIDIYGPTVKDFGFYPYKNGVVVEVEGLKCRPCGLHGHKVCPIKTHDCMEKIKPEFVLEKVDKILS